MNRMFLGRFENRTAGIGRPLVLLPILAGVLLASGCIATRSYASDPYGYGYSSHSRGSSFGYGYAYAPQRTIFVRPTRVIVQRPVYRHNVVRPAPRVHRQAVRQYGARHADRRGNLQQLRNRHPDQNQRHPRDRTNTGEQRHDGRGRH